MSKPTQLDLTLPESFAPTAGSTTEGNETWSKPYASPQGMNFPFYITSMTYEYPGYTTLVLHASDGGECVTIGDLGMQVWKSLVGLALGESPLRIFAPCDNWPLDGWQVTCRWCDQTGGMTMVDVFVFKNGLCASLTSECVVMWKSVDDYLSDGDEGSSIGYVDIAEGF